jgi:hypothetical protein
MKPNSLQLFELLDELDGVLYSLSFRYFGDAKTSLAGARQIMGETLQAWLDDDAQTIREWLKYAYPAPEESEDRRAAHIAFAIGHCREVVRRRWLGTQGVTCPDGTTIKRPHDIPVSVRVMPPKQEREA